MSRSRAADANAMAPTPFYSPRNLRFRGAPQGAPRPLFGRGPAAILNAPREFGCLPAVVGDGAELRRFGCDRRWVADDDDRDVPGVVVGPQSLYQCQVAEARPSEVGEDDLRRRLLGATHRVGLVEGHEHGVALILET